MNRFDVDGLVDLEQGLLSPRIFFDDDIYQAEMDNIFARAWQFLAHASMIPNTGDFVQMYMGEDPVLVIRQADGSVKAFLNQCRHRGMRICRADMGNARAFTCTYHGWAYDIGGRLINVPHEDDGYRNELDKDAWGPVQVAQVHDYKGFIFGTWDPEAPSFVDYLGDFAWYFDAFVDQYPGGFEVAPTAHKWITKANWKFAAEQFATDGYHGPISHASAHVIYLPYSNNTDAEGARKVRAASDARKYTFTSGKGHGTGFARESPRAFHPDVAPYEEEILPGTIERLGEVRAKGVQGHATIFPNFSYLNGSGSFRVWLPRGPHEIETWSWTAVPAEAPPEYKAWRRTSVMRTFSPAGLWEQDDGENWNEIQKVMRGSIARRSVLNAQMGQGWATLDQDGLPGRTTAQIFSEEAGRGMYARWVEMLAGHSWAELDELEAARAVPPVSPRRLEAQQAQEAQPAERT